jgi:hypothetical protein
MLGRLSRAADSKHIHAGSRSDRAGSQGPIVFAAGSIPSVAAVNNEFVMDRFPLPIHPNAAMSCAAIIPSISLFAPMPTSVW